MKDFFQSSYYSRMMALLAALIVALIVFWAGTTVGYRQAVYSHGWNEGYADQFGGPRSPFAMGPADHDSPIDAHGAFGTVVGVRLPEIVIKGPSEVEKTVTLNSGTTVRHFRDAASTTDIAVGQTVVVIGEPDAQGTISASLVRIFPARPTSK